MIKLWTNLPEGFLFFSQMLHVSFLLMLADLLLTVPVQPLVTDRDVNSGACDNHVPAYN